MCGRGLLFLTIYSSEVFQFFTMSMYFFYNKNKLAQTQCCSLPPTHKSLLSDTSEALPTPACGWGLCPHCSKSSGPTCGQRATPGITSTLAVAATPQRWQLLSNRRDGKKTHVSFLYFCTIWIFNVHAFFSSFFFVNSDYMSFCFVSGTSLY